MTEAIPELLNVLDLRTIGGGSDPRAVMDCVLRAWLNGRRPRKAAVGQTPQISKKTLEGMVEEATVDAYGDAEQAGGFFTMIEGHLHVPFSTTILGVEVIVTKIDMTEADEIVAVCHHGKQKQRIPILELPLPSAPPEGAEWIAAYRYWQRGGR